MRAWGLFVSTGIDDGEPPLFNEPGVFLVRPDGTVYYEAILSMPLGRPKLDDLLTASPSGRRTTTRRAARPEVECPGRPRG